MDNYDPDGPIDHPWSDDDLPEIPEPDEAWVSAHRLPDLLREMRHDAGLGGYDVRSAPGSPRPDSFVQSTINDWENGHHTPSDANLRRVTAIYASHIDGADADQMYRLALLAKRNLSGAAGFEYAWAVTRLADALSSLPRPKMLWITHVLMVLLGELRKHP